MKLCYNKGEMQTPFAPERNPNTEKTHRREVLLQITLPILVGVLIVIALATLVSSGSTNELGRWSQVTVIWLVLPVLLLSLLVLVLLAALIYGVSLLLGVIPRYACLTQYWFERVEGRVRKGADLAAEPVIKWQSARASMRRLFGRKDKTGG